MKKLLIATVSTIVAYLGIGATLSFWGCNDNRHDRRPTSNRRKAHAFEIVAWGPIAAEMAAIAIEDIVLDAYDAAREAILDVYEELRAG